MACSATVRAAIGVQATAALLAIVVLASVLGVRAVSAQETAKGLERPGFREFTIRLEPGAKTGFTLMPPSETGLIFTNSIPEPRHLTNQILLNGSGVTAGDVDGDGLTDVFLAGFDTDNALFRNRGEWRFDDITAAAGVALPGYDCTGAAMADLDGDGDLDLVVNTLAQGTVILFNNGTGRFEQRHPPLAPGRGAMTAALADVDGDGFLDLYVANYRTQALMDMPNTRMTFKKAGAQTVVDTVNGRSSSEPEFGGRFVVNAAGGIEENGEPDILFRNVHGTNFVATPWTEGAFLDESGKPLSTPPRDWGLAAMFRDVNGDHLPDLYVCNDFQSPDRFWRNLGGGRFQLMPPLALRRTSLSSMAVDFADINADGHDDLLVLEMMTRDHRQRLRWVRENFPHAPVIGRYDDRPQIEQNTLQLGRADGTWDDVAPLAGLEAAEWAWGCAFLDVDLDGREDVLIVNGMERAARDLDAADQIRAQRQGRRLTDRQIFEARRAFPRLATGNLAFRNRGDLRFVDVSAEWGFNLDAVSQCLALADLDNDGDMDVIVGNLNQAATMYRNNASAPRLGIRLRGRGANSRGIGARIEVLGGPIHQSQEMVAGGRYLSGDDPVRSFAVLNPEKLEVRVRWPGGRVSRIQGLKPNTRIEIDEASAPEDSVEPLAAERTSIQFEDVSNRLNHRHHEEASDDFASQPLLPHRLSQAGPGLAWHDFDGDGDPDLAIGSGAGGRLGVFRNQVGRFEPWKNSALEPPLPRDATALVAWPTTNRSVLLAALSNVEDASTLGASVVAWDPASTAASFSEIVPAGDSSPGPLAIADIDQDGDLDLFVGGRSVVGRWPSAASSRFYRNQNGRFIPDTERSRIVHEIGNVQGAVFSDLDSDGDGDLVLAVEFGPVTVLRQDPTGFVNITESLGIAKLKGLWTSVAVGDFDADGRMDFVAGNWGRNTPYERHQVSDPIRKTSPHPLWRIYHGDFNADGTHDILESVPVRLEAGVRFLPVQPLTTLAPALPFLKGRFPSHEAFANAGVEGILGDALARTPLVEADTWDSTLFLNRGTSFEPHPLPTEAQFAPVFGIAVADADGDGLDDLFLAQNFFAVRPHTPRYDGGRGVWLRNRGDGNLTVIPGSQTGVILHGEQRGAALADFDRDGRIDLAVGQNGAETRLFRNLAAKPGVSIRLAGPPENPAGVGARLRWSAAGSAAREIRLGGGYLSQDATTLTMTRTPADTPALEVKWPRGEVRKYTIPANAAEVVVRPDGSIESGRRP